MCRNKSWYLIQTQSVKNPCDPDDCQQVNPIPALIDCGRAQPVPEKGLCMLLMNPTLSSVHPYSSRMYLFT